MGVIKIFRALKPDETGYQFHEMLEIATESRLINDLAWAPGCIRPFDLVSAACDDGCVRIFEITTPHEVNLASTALSRSAAAATTGTPSTTARTAPSGIGAGLAGVSRIAARHSAASLRIKHEWKELKSLQHDDGKPVWKVRWMHDGKQLGHTLPSIAHQCAGNALVSTGDSGKVHLWKQHLNGDFIEFAETGPS